MAAVLLVGSVGLRLAWIWRWPTEPISDFAGIIEFAEHLSRQGFGAPGYYWETFNPAFPLALAVLFEWTPGSDHVALSRGLMAVLTGLLPVAVWLGWRRVLPFGVRLGSALALACWPGLVAFSGVVAQDNAVTVPAICLLVLAVGALRGERARPIVAGLLWGIAGAVRQEMLLALAPLALAAVWPSHASGADRTDRQVAWRLLLSGGLLRRLALTGVVALTILSGFASLRSRATGSWSLTSAHAGYTLLGSVAPGASRDFWVDPATHIAAVAPELGADRARLMVEAGGLARQELARRPLFHLARTFAALTWFATRVGADATWWSLAAPGVLPSASAAEIYSWARVVLQLSIGGEILLLATLIIGFMTVIWGRRWWLLLPLLAILAKPLLHAFLVAQGRFLIPALAMAVTVAPVLLWTWWRLPRRRLWWLPLTLLVAVAVHHAAPELRRVVVAHDQVPPRTYQFVLTAWGSQLSLNCSVSGARLDALGSQITRFVATSAAGAVMVCSVLGPVAAEAELVIEPFGEVPAGAIELATDGASSTALDLLANPAGSGHGLALERNAAHEQTIQLRFRAPESTALQVVLRAP